jgi:hypothetical protein
VALAFRSNHQTINGTASASCVVTAPSGIADDDILIFALERADVTAAITWPSGFTELFDTTHDGGSTACAWKRASSESGNYTASWTGTTRNVGIMYAVSGAATAGTPVTIGTTATGSGTTPDPPSSDPGSSDDRLAVVVIGQEGKGDARFTPPSGYTEPATNSDGGTTGGGSGAGHCGLGLSYRTYTGQAENPGTATSATNDGWAANTIVFDPLAASIVSLAASISASALMAAPIARDRPFDAAITGSGAAAAAFGATKGLSSAVTGSVVVTADANRTVGFSSAIVTSGSVTASTSTTVGLSADISASVIATATLDVIIGYGIGYRSRFIPADGYYSPVGYHHLGRSYLRDTLRQALVRRRQPFLIQPAIPPSIVGLSTTVSCSVQVGATLSATKLLTADVATAGTVTASLLAIRGFVADISGSSLVVAALDRTRGLAVDIGGTTLVTANLSGTFALVAAINGSALLASDLTRTRGLAASISTTATTTADIIIAGAVQQLVAAIAGNALVAADVTRRRGLAATVDGTTSVTASLDRTVGLVCPISTSVTVTAKFGRIRGLAAAMSGTSFVTADLSVLGSVDFVAGINATATVAAALSAERQLAADIVTSGAMAAALSAERQLTANIDANAQVNADFNRSRALVADIVTSAELTGNLTSLRNLSAIINCTAVVTSALSRTAELSANISGTAFVTASLIRIRGLLADIQTSAFVTADLSFGVFEVTTKDVDWLYRNDRHYPAVGVTVGTPFAEFTWDATTAPPTVFFTNQSVGATSWMWDFGDSQSSTDPNPTHTFAFVGTSATFAVSLYINGDPNLSVTHLVEVTLLTGAPNLTLNTLTIEQLNTLTISQLNTLPVA